MRKKMATDKLQNFLWPAMELCIPALKDDVARGTSTLGLVCHCMRVWLSSTELGILIFGVVQSMGEFTHLNQNKRDLYTVKPEVTTVYNDHHFEVTIGGFTV
jgi:hypothetical protein